MKNYFLSLLFSFYILTAQSQHQPQWVTLYGNSPAYSFDPSDMAIDNSGNIFVTYSATDSVSSKAVLIKVNPTGSVLWQYKDTDMGYYTHVAVAASQNIYHSGGANIDIRTRAFDQSGGIQWMSDFDQGCNLTDHLYAITTDDSANLYLTGESWNCNTSSGTNNDIVTIKYDSSGNLQWSRFYDGGDNAERGMAIAVDSWHNVYVSGRSGDSLYDNSDFIIKYDLNGNEKWFHRITNTGFGVASLISIFHDTLIILAGSRVDTTGFARPFSAGYDSSGNVRWFSPFDTSFYSSSDYMVIDEFGNSYLTGFYVCHVLKVSNTGNLLWNRELNPILGGVVYTLLTSDHHGMFYAGLTLYDHVGMQYPMIYQFDSSGTVLDSFSYSFPPGSGGNASVLQYDPQGALLLTGSEGDSTGNNIHVMKFSIPTGINSPKNIDLRVDVFPNPFSEFTIISAGNVFREPGNMFTLFDFTGREIRKGKFNSQEFKLYKNGLSNGVYFLRLTNVQGLQSSAKLIVE